MDLPNLFSSGTKVKTEELVLFLVLTDVKIQTILLELSTSGVEMLDKSKEFDYEGLDKCVEQSDLALQQLNKKSENVSEAIFAVNSSWVKNGEVIDEKKPFVKKLSDDLNLKPLGFIDVNESLAQQKLSENALFSGIIVVFTKSELVFTLIYQGKIKKTEIVGSSIDFKSDFDEGIARIKTDIEKQGNYLPPKIMLASFDLSEKELHDYQQQVYDQDWDENSLFVQTPTVEVISDQKMLKALSTEAGRNAAVQKGLPDFALAASLVGSKEAKIQQAVEVNNLDSEEFGFQDPINKKIDTKEEMPTSFGIPIKINDFNSEVSGDDDNLIAVEDDFLNENNEIVLDKMENKKIDWSDKKYIKWFVGIGFSLGLLFLIAGVIFGASLFATTSAEITLNKKLVSKDIELTLDTNVKETDVEKLIIAADTVTKTAKDKSTIQTTGIKIVGEKATGKVAIYNKTDAEKTFSKDTQLKFGDLVFLIDEEVKIASSSPKPGGEDYGRADITVTAAQIGADSNLEKDDELTVAAYDTSTYNAYIIEDNFTGGSSREVRVVAQADLDELLADLRNDLVEKINEEFADESGNGTYILPSKSIINETSVFDAEVEDEAESVSLDLDIEIEAVTYSGGDLKPVAQEILSKDLPDKYLLEDSDPQILSSPSQTDLDKLESEAVVSIEANISSYAIPQLDENEIKDSIKGKTFNQAIQELAAREEISEVSFSVIPNFLKSFVKKVATSSEKIVVKFIK